ncbi:hypothetical protein GQ53DRAFT_847451 [Thozetella sp. PMI_491]|nr:hypothetical protein GQ53DRAFT_847451 [Thozetella sp. PMI_491]
MYTTRIFSLLTVALSFLFIAQASWIDINLLGRHAEVVAIQQRAETTPTGKDQGDAAASSATSSPAQSTTSAPAKTTTSSEKSSSTSAPGITSTSSSDKPQSTSSTPSSTTPPPSSTTSTPDESSTSSSKSQEVQTTVVVYTTTDDSGHTTAVTSSATITTTPGLDSNSASTSSGMPETTRNTIIGVVVGVGGAIVLAGMALIAWRIWGRKKNQEEGDGLMGYTGPEKSEVGTSAVGSSTRSPFQSTLESYHAPTQVNTASNF